MDRQQSFHAGLQGRQWEVPRGPAIVPSKPLEAPGETHLRVMAWEDLRQELILSVGLVAEGVRPPIGGVGLEGPVESSQVVLCETLLQVDLDFSCRGSGESWRYRFATGLEELSQRQEAWSQA